MNRSERADYFLYLNDKYLIRGASIPEWCIFISESAYNAFINFADLAAVITALVGIESFLRIDNGNIKYKNLITLIDEYKYIDTKTKNQIHVLRKYRNRWVHFGEVDENPILENKQFYVDEAEKMSILAMDLMMRALLSQPIT